MGDPKDGEEMLVAFIGEQDQDQENQITILKGCRLLETIGDIPMTKERILRAIETLNQETRSKLGLWRQVKAYRAKDPTVAHPGCAPATGKKIYCEDHRLSLQVPGQPCLGIDIKHDHEAGQIPTLSKETAQEIIDTLLCFRDLKSYANPGKETKKTIRRMEERKAEMMPSLLSRL